MANYREILLEGNGSHTEGCRYHTVNLRRDRLEADANFARALRREAEERRHPIERDAASEPVAFEHMEMIELQ